MADPHRRCGRTAAAQCGRTAARAAWFYCKEDEGVCTLGGLKVGQKPKEGKEGRRYGPATM